MKNKKNLPMIIGTSLAIILTIVALVLKIIIMTSPAEKPIVPVTPKKDKSTLSPTKKKKKEKTTTSSAKPTKEGSTKTVILSAKEDGGDSFSGESVKKYLVEKPIEEEGLSVFVTSVAVGKLDPDSMDSLGFTGEGLVDVNLSIQNKSKKDVKITPTKIKLRVNNTEYDPLETMLKDGVVKPDEKQEGSLSIAMPKLKNSDEIKDVNFHWKTETEGVVQEYKVTIKLK